MVFNVATLNTAIGDIVVKLSAPVSSVQSAIVAYSLLVAAFTVTGGKLSVVLGPRTTQLLGLSVYMAGTAITTLAPSIRVLIFGQAVAGLGAALLLPNSMAVVMQAYSGRPREVALAVQAGLAGIGASLGLLFGGALVSLRGWRAAFLGMLVMQAIAFVIAWRLHLPRSGPAVKVDATSVVLSATGIVLIIAGVNQVGPWGLLTARPSAPFSLMGISPALLMLLAGGLIFRMFLVRQRQLRIKRSVPLLAPEVMDSRITRASVLALVVATLLLTGAAYLMLLYTQVVLNYSAIRSALFILPLSLAAFGAAVAAPALTRRWPPRIVVGAAIVLGAGATFLLAAKISNAWNSPALWIDEILIGTGVGVVLAVATSVLVSSVPESLSSDVGSTQGATSVGTAFGTAIAGAVLLTVLASKANTLVEQKTEFTLPPTVELSPTSVAFVSNDDLRVLLSKPPWNLEGDRLEEAVQINIEARLAALRASLTILALLGLFALGALSSLPGRQPKVSPREPLQFPSPGS